MEVTTGTIKIKSSSEECEYSFILPKTVADDIICQIIDWKNIWLFTPADYERFLEKKKEIEKELKK